MVRPSRFDAATMVGQLCFVFTYKDAQTLNKQHRYLVIFLLSIFHSFYNDDDVATITTCSRSTG